MIKLKIKIIKDVEIKTVKDLENLRIFMEVNKLDKPNYSQIARELGVDRRTVKKYYEGNINKERKPRKSILDDYYDVIKNLLSNESTQMFYYKDHLFRYLQREKGLKCSRNNFNYYILRNEEFASYFKNNKKDNSVKSETPFGNQAQFDWKEKINFQFKNREKIQLNIGSIVLSASRFKVWAIYPSVSLDCILDFLANSFETLGGTPKELIIDNATTMMIQARTMVKKGRINPKFEQFANDYNFKIIPCVAGRPQTKAKVENPMRIIDEIMSYNGVVENLEELHEKLNLINNEANSRVCQSTGLPPILVYNKEKEHLLSLPQERISSYYKLKSTKVKVNSNALISYRKSMYSVPPQVIGKTVTIQIIDDKLHVYYNKNLLTVHDINTNKKIIYKKEHHSSIIRETFTKDPEVEVHAIKHLKDLEAFNEQLSELTKQLERT